MTRFFIAMALFAGVWLAVSVPMAEAAPCLIVTLTGTQSGPSVFNGQAGAGTLVRYGDDSNDCAAMKLQFDIGRGTNVRLSQIDVTPVQLNAIFFTHMHSDHTEGFADIMMLRWYFKGPKIDIVCSSDATSVLGVTNSCRKFVMHVTDAFIQSGEIAERRSEDNTRLAGGPADLTSLITFDPQDEPQVVCRRRRRQRCARTAACSLDIRSSGEIGEGGGRHRALSVPPRLGTGPGQRISATVLLSPKPGLRSRRHGKARGGEAPYAHTSGPIARSGDTQPLEGSGRSVNTSGLPRSGRGGRVHRKYYCGDRPCDPAASGEVIKVRPFL